jgi:DNA polymerase-4
MLRRIVHVDMDAFYASVEQRDNPSLRGKPLAGRRPAAPARCRGGSELRGARLRRALGNVDGKGGPALPPLQIVPPRISPAIRTPRGRFFAIFREVTRWSSRSRSTSISRRHDNAWGESLGMIVAKRIKERIRGDIGLTASAGVAPNKFLAKIASGWKKPDGLTVIARTGRAVPADSCRSTRCGASAR